MEKILNIDNNPPFKFELNPSYRTAIINSEADLKPWFLSSFLQLSCIVKEQKQFMINFETNRFLIEYDLAHKTSINIDKTISKIKKLIDNNRYVCLMWDEFFVPSRVTFKKTHNKHQVLIYGYNTEKQIFHILGFNLAGSYGSSTISFADFKKAYQYFPTSVWKVFILNKAKTKFNYKRFNREITWYLYSKYPLSYRIINSFSFLKKKSFFERKQFFGMDTYKFLKESILNKDPRSNTFISVFCNHKNHLMESFKFIKDTNSFQNIDDIIQRYESVVNKFEIVKALYLKYTITGSEKHINSAVSIIDEIVPLEELILSDYLNNIV